MIFATLGNFFEIYHITLVKHWSIHVLDRVMSTLVIRRELELIIYESWIKRDSIALAQLRSFSTSSTNRIDYRLFIFDFLIIPVAYFQRQYLLWNSDKIALIFVDKLLTFEFIIFFVIFSVCSNLNLTKHVSNYIFIWGSHGQFVKNYGIEKSLYEWRNSSFIAA